MTPPPTYTAFSGPHLIVSGPLREVLVETKKLVDMGEAPRVLVFEDASGRQVEFNFRGTVEEMLERAAPVVHHDGPGRPRLGVVAREVTLLPRHWEWLERQPNGASAALRRLVEEARKATPALERARLAAEAAHRFMTSLAGNLEGYEEALRALYRRDRKKFVREIRGWPEDVRDKVAKIAQPAFAKRR